MAHIDRDLSGGGSLSLEERARPATTSDPDLPTRIDRFTVLREIGRGGIGIVLEVRDEDLLCLRAIKILQHRHRDNHGLRLRFEEESQIIAQLEGRGVVPVIGRGRLADDRPYYVMQRISGRTLGDLLADRASPAENLVRFLDLFRATCRTLASAHAHGVVHRDLKPRNVMVGPDDEAIVMDWGLARVLRRGLEETNAQRPCIETIRTASPGASTQAGAVLGTPGYMAPEQARGDVGNQDERADVFGLGAILCEILTGRPPYTGGNETVRRHSFAGDTTAGIARLRACGAPAEVIALAEACLEDVPANRPASATEVMGQLEPILARLHDADGAARRELLEAEQLLRTGRLTEAASLVRRQRDQLRGPGGERLRHLHGDLLRDTALYEGIVRARRVLLGELSGLRSRRGRCRPYRRAFRRFGLDLARCQTGEVGERMSRSLIRSVVVAGLDEWAWLTQDGSVRQRLNEIANLADPEREGVRARLRNALRWNDEDLLFQIAARIQQLPLGPEESIRLASAVRHRADGGYALDVLRYGWERTGDPRVAWHLARLVVQTDPTRANEAIALLEDAVGRHSQSWPLHHQVGKRYLARGEADRAEAAYRAALEARPRTFAPRYGLGALLAHRRRDDEAEPQLRQAFASAGAKPARIAACSLALAFVSIRRGAVGEGMEWFEKACAHRVPEAHHQVRLGWLLEQRDRFDLAESAYRSGLSSLASPKSRKQRRVYLRASMGLGRVLDRLGRPDEGESFVRQALRVRARVRGAQSLLVRLTLHRQLVHRPGGGVPPARYWQRDLETIHRRVLDSSPSPNSCEAYQQILRLHGEQLSARGELERQARALAREHTLGLLRLARLHLDAGNVGQARLACARALDLDGATFDDWFTFGETLLFQAGAFLARRAFARAAVLDPGHVEVLVKEGQAALLCRALEHAQACFRQALERSPGCAPATQGLREVRRARGDEEPEVEAPAVEAPGWLGGWWRRLRGRP